MIYTKRKAFSLITAIFVILLMATVAVFIMNLSGKIVKETTSQYQKEQAVLLAKSYTELAIMTVMSNDRNGTGICVDAIDGVVGPPGASTNGQGYNVRTRIGFIGAASDIGPCAIVRKFGNPATNDELNIIVDVYVEYKDISNPNLDPAVISSTPWITYHRRTLQKI